MATTDLRDRVLAAQPPLAAHTIHVWRAAFSSIAPQAEQLLPVLSSDEQARAERFRFPRHRDAFIAGRAMLRTVLGNYCGRPPEALRFLYGEQQKPRLDDNGRPGSRSVAFNLSHTLSEIQIAVAAESPVGIDVEDADREFDLEGLIAECLTEEEARRLSHSAHRRREFIRYWVHKEAFLKCMGTGFTVPPKEVQVTIDPSGRSEMRCSNPLASAVLFGRELECSPGHLAALAGRERDCILHSIAL